MKRINKITTLGERDCVVLYPEMAHRESMELGNNGIVKDCRKNKILI